MAGTTIMENSEHSVLNAVEVKHELFGSGYEFIGRILHQGQEFDLECYSGLTEIADLKNDWKKLAQLGAEPFTYFQSFDWSYKWCEQFSSSNPGEVHDKPQVFVLRHEGRVAMILPLIINKSRAAVKVLVRMTDPLGQYTNLLHDPELFDVALGKQVIDMIKQTTSCDAIAMNHIPAESLLADIADGDGFREREEHKSSMLNLDLIEDWDEYSKTLSKSQRRTRKRKRKQLEEMGELRFEVHFADTAEYKHLVEECLKMKRVWLEETGRREGILHDEKTQEFLTGLDCETDAQGQHEGALVMALLLDGVPIGLEIGMISNRDYYSFLGAIDWKYNKYSPGVVQMEDSQKWAKDQGLRYYDFLGDPSQYKSSWTNVTSDLVCQHIPVTPAGYLYCWMWKTAVKPKLKRYYHGTGAANRKLFNMLFNMVGAIQGIRN